MCAVATAASWSACSACRWLMLTIQNLSRSRSERKRIRRKELCASDSTPGPTGGTGSMWEAEGGERPYSCPGSCPGRELICRKETRYGDIILYYSPRTGRWQVCPWNDPNIRKIRNKSWNTSIRICSLWNIAFQSLLWVGRRVWTVTISIQLYSLFLLISWIIFQYQLNIF